MSHYESDRGYGLRVAVYMLVGMSIGNLVGSLVREDPDDRVRRVQVQYEQVEDQLERSRQIGNLMLDDKEHKFSFDSPIDGHCTGTYEVSGNNDEIAQIATELACTQAVPAER